MLKPGGRLEVVDFAGGARSLHDVLHGRQASPQADERLLERMREAGLTDARRTGARGTLVGAVAYYQALAPSRSAPARQPGPTIGEN